MINTCKGLNDIDNYILKSKEFNYKLNSDLIISLNATIINNTEKKRIYLK